MLANSWPYVIPVEVGGAPVPQAEAMYSNARFPPVSKIVQPMSVAMLYHCADGDPLVTHIATSHCREWSASLRVSFLMEERLGCNLCVMFGRSVATLAARLASHFLGCLHGSGAKSG